MNILSSIKRHSVLATTLAVVVVVSVVIAGRVAARKGGDQADAGSGARQVTLVDVSQFRAGTSTVSADGVVESASQVDLKSQMSAPLSAVNVAVGQSVSAGDVIAELQNADIRAGLEQARASLALAQGQYSSGAIALDSVRTTAVEKVRDSYTAADEAVHAQIDQFLFNESGGSKPLTSYTSDIKLVDRLHAERDDLTNYFAAWQKAVNALDPRTSSTADIRAALSQSKKVLDAVQSLLDDMSLALNTASKDASSGTADTISGWKAVIAAAKASISGANTALTSIGASFESALSSQQASAPAQVGVAEAGVKNLEAQLVKTVVRTPISGKVAALPLRVGELAAPGQLIATVVGGGGLQVKAYVSGEDLSRIAKGARVSIGGSQGKAVGTVESVSPSVDPTTRKAEVRVIVSDPDASGLVVGQSVPVRIQTAALSGAASSYFLPIQDVKIVPGAAYVFTVDADSKAASHEVILGKVDGDFIEIASGLSDDMKIATPVYELQEGQIVNVR